MKIGAEALVGDALIDRMRSAHEAAAEHGAVGGDLDESNLTSMEARLSSVAERALRGDFSSAAEVRADVLDVLVDEQLGGVLDAEARGTLLETLDAALGGDPEFLRQVDEMLILAASQVPSDE